MMLDELREKFKQWTSNKKQTRNPTKLYQTCFNDTDVARRSICENQTNNEQDFDEDLAQIVSFSVFILFGIIGIIGFIGNALVVIGK